MSNTCSWLLIHTRQKLLLANKRKWNKDTGVEQWHQCRARKLPSLSLKQQSPHTVYSTHLTTKLRSPPQSLKISPAEFLLPCELLKHACRHLFITKWSVGKLLRWGTAAARSLLIGYLILKPHAPFWINMVKCYVCYFLCSHTNAITDHPVYRRKYFLFTIRWQ